LIAIKKNAGAYGFYMPPTIIPRTSASRSIGFLEKGSQTDPKKGGV